MKTNAKIDFTKLRYRDGSYYYHDVPLILYANSKNEIYTEINGHRFYMVIKNMPLKTYTTKRIKK